MGLDARRELDDKGDQRNGNHDVDPHKPAQECKVGGHAGSKVGFDFLDAQLPGDEDGEEAGGLPFPVSPSLGREKKKDLCLRGIAACKYVF